MWKIVVFCFLVLFSGFSWGGECDVVFENTVEGLCDIVNGGNIDCLEDFIKKNPNLLNEKLDRNEIIEGTAFDKQNYGLTNNICRGETPLTLAAKWHDLPMMKMLINAGADINSQDDNGNTALMISVSRHYSFYVDEMDVLLASALTDFAQQLGGGGSAAIYHVSKDPVARLERARRTDVDLENYFTYQSVLMGGTVYQDIVDYLLEAGADANIINKNNQNALSISLSAAPVHINPRKLLDATRFNDDVFGVSGHTVTASAYCIDASNFVDVLIQEGYDKYKQGRDGKSLCDVVNYMDFQLLGCEEFECNIQNKDKILPCVIPNGEFDWDACVDKTYGTKICDGTKWSECSFERGDNSCMIGFSRVGYCMDGKCCGDVDNKGKNTQGDVSEAVVESSLLDNGFVKKYDVELSQKKSQKKIDELQKNADAMKEKEQYAGNKLLGGLAIGGAGIGGMMAASAYSEQTADEDAERAMRAYLATFTCKYGDKRVAGGEQNVELPGGNELVNLYTEYVNLANNLKVRKAALEMSPGIESESILDSATSGLYDDVAIGKTSGTFTSLAHALQNPEGADATTWAAQKEDSAKQLKTGATVGAGGAVGGAVGNLIINKDDMSGAQQQEK